jgi:DnaK suppressor protein
LLTKEQKAQVEQVIKDKLTKVKCDILAYEELTKPIGPENAIGRISRMDAINNKSVNEAALRNSRKKRIQLERSLRELPSGRFGVCRQCERAIELEKLLVVPESILCISCVKNARR